jgi:DNA-directed RNA polymerase alpha subunit
MKEGIVKDAFVGESIRVLNEKIDEWELPVRLRNICKNNGIIYSYDLTKLTASQFLKLHHCGKQALIQMINIMLIKGIKFKE